MTDSCSSLCSGCQKQSFFLLTLCRCISTRIWGCHRFWGSQLKIWAPHQVEGVEKDKTTKLRRRRFSSALFLCVCANVWALLNCVCKRRNCTGMQELLFVLCVLPTSSSRSPVQKTPQWSANVWEKQRQRSVERKDWQERRRKWELSLKCVCLCLRKWGVA